MSRGRAKFVQSLQIMLSPKEAQYIRRYADAAGMTRSGYGRQVIKAHLETKILMEVSDVGSGRDGQSVGKAGARKHPA